MSEVLHLHQLIDALHELSVEGSEENIKNIALVGLERTEKALRTASVGIVELACDDTNFIEDSLITPESLAEMATIASEFDKTGDILLMKQAAVLDEILLTIGAQKAAVSAARRAADEEISRLKSLASEKEYDPYTASKKIHDASNHATEAKAAISKIKEYRPMEAPLNTRTCPDHPGAQMARIAEHTYQCSLDKGIYNYETGYTTMKGNKIPGGDVSTQTQALYDRPNEFTSFETRESRLSSSQ